MTSPRPSSSVRIRTGRILTIPLLVLALGCSQPVSEVKEVAAETSPVDTRSVPEPQYFLDAKFEGAVRADQFRFDFIYRSHVRISGSCVIRPAVDSDRRGPVAVQCAVRPGR